jgi:hypothetical protein
VIKNILLLQKSPLTNLPYFFAGVTCASVIECWHFASQSFTGIDDLVTSILFACVGPNSSCYTPVDIRIFAGDVKSLFSVIWRFLPDVVAFIFYFLLTSYGDLATDDVARYSMWVTLPIVFLGSSKSLSYVYFPPHALLSNINLNTISAFLFVSMLQKKNFKMCLSRYILETSFLGGWGYASLNLFLFQHIFIEFYFPTISTGTVWYKSGKSKWYKYV